jgi:3-isopropylmalate/(R)-2-methylmalate dehydratase small subunit
MNDIIIKGKAVVLKMNDVSTDHIYPVKYINLTDPAQIAEHVLEGADKSFKDRFRTIGNILVTGTNFGSGSSREHAVIALKEAGIKAVIANTVARIWYRNAINLALPVIFCRGLVELASEGDELEIDLKSGQISNLTKRTVHQGQPLSDFVLNVIRHGGTKEMMRHKLTRLKIRTV